MMLKRKTLDPFRQRKLQDVGARFNTARQYHRQASDAMWRGILSTFSDFDLALLLDAGFISRHDQDLMKQAARPITSPKADAMPDRET